MKKRQSLFLTLFYVLGILTTSAQVNVDVNLNMKHSVNGVSDFGRDRHMNVHSSLTENDWTGHEDMLNYLINDLDVYFGRETGSATWKMQAVEEDPNHPGWPNEAQMKEHGYGLRQWYESDDFSDRRQYESKSNMIMGINDYSPMYPNLSWYEGFGKGVDGWYVKDTDAAAEWVSLYLKYYFSTHPDSIGEQLPVYWECYNEPDMNFMNISFGMIVSSLEKNWEYHKLVAQDVRQKLGSKAPKIGGMTWGQIDPYKPDGVNRTDGQFWYDNSSAEAGLLYDNMLSGVGSGIPNPGVGKSVWPKAWDNRTDKWWQWDFMYQGFIDFAGADMDFYGVHMYDWPSADETQTKANTRAGGHIEAMLDMFEWYDTQKFGAPKDIVISEFGAVNNSYISTLPKGERDWPFLKSFNQMQMQFLERPSQVVYTMPFDPVKAVWGASFSGNNVVRYPGATLMDPLGDWTGDAATWTMNEPTGGWSWSTLIHFYELWKDVDGTRIDTKSSDIDIQVDAYVSGKHVYLILNNTIDEDKTINLNLFGSSTSISNVELRHLYLGDDKIPKYTIQQLSSAPSQVSLKPNSTIVLDYTFSNNVNINQESKETKYMCEPLAGSQTNKRGTQLCHTASSSSITATVTGVQKPSKGEAIIRVGGFFSNPLDGTTGMKVKKLTVNGNPVIAEADNFIANIRGYGMGSYQGAWFGVLELECPIEYLKNGNNTVYFERWQGVEFTTIMIQVFDMTTDPGRTNAVSANLAPSVNAGSDQALAVGSTSVSLSATASDPNGDTLTYSWSQVSGSSVSFSNSNSLNTSVSGLSNGNTYVFRFSASDGEATSIDDVTITVAASVGDCSDSPVVIEAESFTSTGGTYNDGQVTGNGVNKTSTTINWVNSGDYANYTINLCEGGVYAIAYQISTPSDNAQIQIAFDGTTASTDNVVNNGAWDNYQNLTAANTVNLSAGIHTMKLTASGSNAWQWNLDKITLTLQSSSNTAPVANAGNDQTLTAGTTSASLSGSGTDANGDMLTYSWSVVSGFATISDASSASTTVSGLSNGSTYLFRLTVSDGSLSDTDDVQITVNEASGQTAYPSGVAHAIPGSIESVNYDNGGEGVAYHDATTSNSGSGIRQDEGVDTEYRIDAGSVGWIATGEWLEYTVNVASAGNYKIEVMVASTGSNGKYHIEFNGTDKTGVQSVSATGGWGTFVTQTISGVALSEGEQVMRVYMDGGSFNLATITFTSESETTAPVELTIEAEDVDNKGGTYNDGFVPVGPGIQTGVGLYWVNNGDWAEYNVNIPEDGEYSIVYNIATPLDNRSIEILSDGTSLNTTTVPNTGNWEVYEPLTASSTENFTAGNHTIRLQPGTTDTWTWNLDKFTLTRIGYLKSAEINTETLSINLYPNPAHDVLNIDVNSELQENATISIYSTTGSVLLIQNLENNNQQISLDKLSSGIYMILIYNGNEMVTKKFIKN